MLQRRLAEIAFWIGLLGASPAFGQFSAISTPTAGYTGSTILIPITGANFGEITSLTDGTQTLTFSGNVSRRTVPGGGWGTWASPPFTESGTPRVVYADATSLTITLSLPRKTFGFEVEPNLPGPYDISVDFRNGGTSLGTVTQSISGASGARLAAASSSTTPITSVVITAPGGANGFAMAQFRYGSERGTTGPAAVPALGPVALGGLAILLAAAGALLARRRNQSA